MKVISFYTLPNESFIIGFSTLAGGYMKYSQILVNSGNYFTYNFSVIFFPQTWVFFNPVSGGQYSLKYLRYHLHKYRELSLWSSLLSGIFPPEDISHFCLHERNRASKLCPPYAARPLGSGCLLLSCSLELHPDSELVPSNGIT